MACQCGHMDVVMELVERGAKVNTHMKVCKQLNATKKLIGRPGSVQIKRNLHLYQWMLKLESTRKLELKKVLILCGELSQIVFAQMFKKLRMQANAEQFQKSRRQ